MDRVSFQLTPRVRARNESTPGISAGGAGPTCGPVFPGQRATAAARSGILRAVDVTEDLVRKTAALARLALSEDEVARAAKDLGRILAHVDALAEARVDPGTPVGAARPVPSTTLRHDVARPCLSRDQALANAPATDRVFFLVPKVLEGD